MDGGEVDEAEALGEEAQVGGLAVDEQVEHQLVQPYVGEPPPHVRRGAQRLRFEELKRGVRRVRWQVEVGGPRAVVGEDVLVQLVGGEP